MKKLSLAVLVSLVLVLTLAGACAPAEGEYPSRPLTMINPWPPGGAVDVSGRIVASGAGDHLGQPLAMKYITGAAGISGAEAIAKAEPDGYTIGLVGSGAIMVKPVLEPGEVTYGRDDLVMIAKIVETPMFFAVSPDAPFKTIPEMVDYVKANPGEIIYSTSGRYGFVHQGWAKLMDATGIAGMMIHLPGAGGAAAVAYALGGSSQVTGGAASVLAPHFEAGTLIPLGVAATERFSALPDVPTIEEVIGIEVLQGFWIGIVAPKGLPADRLQFLREAFKNILNDASVMKLATRAAAPIDFESGEDLRKRWEADFAASKALESLLKQ